MYKHFYGAIFICLMFLPGELYCQARTDSSVNNSDTVSVQTDSSAAVVDSSGAGNEIATNYLSNDSLYLPVADSSLLNNYTFREVPRSKVNKYLADREYEYANDPEYWKKDEPPKNPDGFSFWSILRNKTFQWILFLSVIALIIYGIFLLARENNFKWFSRTSNQPHLPVPDSSEAGPVYYDQLITKYQAEGNYRFAIRYLFLRLIHDARDKNIIQMRDSTTNAEIGRSFGNHPLAAQYRYLARAYEYIYFGDFNVNREIFDSLKMKFEVFHKKISA
jgi:hypothetical protein